MGTRQDCVNEICNNVTLSTTKIGVSIKIIKYNEFKIY